MPGKGNEWKSKMEQNEEQYQKLLQIKDMMVANASYVTGLVSEALSSTAGLKSVNIDAKLNNVVRDSLNVALQAYHAQYHADTYDHNISAVSNVNVHLDEYSELTLPQADAVLRGIELRGEPEIDMRKVAHNERNIGNKFLEGGETMGFIMHYINSMIHSISQSQNEHAERHAIPPVHNPTAPEDIGFIRDRFNRELAERSSKELDA